MKLLVKLLSLLLVISACNEGFEAPGQQGDKVLDPPPSVQPQGVFEAKKGDLDILPQGCDEGKMVFDERLLQQDSFVLENLSRTDGRATTRIPENYSLKFSLVVGDPSRVTRRFLFDGLSSKHWMESQCDVTEVSSFENCEQSEVSKEMKSYLKQKKLPVAIRKCKLASTLKDYKLQSRSYQKGTYHFANSGPSVTAFREQSIETGTIQCDPVGKGEMMRFPGGTLITVKLMSDQVPAVVSGFSCGAEETLYQYAELKDSTGNLISVKKFEIKASTF